MRTSTYQSFKYIFTAMMAVLMVVGFLVPALKAEAQFNQQINYQGKLTNATGVAVPDGLYNMNFWLVASSTAATSSAVWAETRVSGNRVQVVNGLFSVMLGAVDSLAAVDFNDTLYLGVEIGGISTTTPVWDGEMSPRKVLGAVPAAFVAGYATTAGTASTSLTLGGVASSSFLRSDEVDTMTASSSSALLTLVQNGVGKIMSLFSGVTEVFTILSNGNVGVGTTTPQAKLQVDGTAIFTNLTSDFAGGLKFQRTSGQAFGFTIGSDNNLYFGYNSVGSSMTAGDELFRITNGGVVNSVGGLSVGNLISTAPPTGGAIIAGNVGIGTTTPIAKLDVVSTLTNSVPDGMRIRSTGSGSGDSGQYAASIILNAGYTGSAGTYGFGAVNNSAGTGTSWLNGTDGYSFRPNSGNVGGYGIAANANTTTGLRMGLIGTAGNGLYNIGTLGSASVDKASTLNVGVAGFALNNHATDPVAVGGYFSLYRGTSFPTISDTAALIADNSSQASPIFLAKDSGTTVFSIVDGGNIGIGTTTPSSKLTVVGNTYIGGDLAVTGTFRDSSNASGTAGMVLQTTGAGTQWVATSSLGISGGASTFLGLTDTPSSYTANRIMFTNSGATALTDSADFVFNGTNLGIGSTTPSARLTVQGASGSTDDLFRVASSTGEVLFKVDTIGRLTAGLSSSADTNLFINGGSTSTAPLRNIGIGYQAFSFASSTGSIPTDNIAMGYRSMYGYSANPISGDNNVAIGNNSLYWLSTGHQNVAIGDNALYNNFSGNSNSAVGYYALRANGDGYYNSAFGTYALRSNYSGIRNSAFGVNALDGNVLGIDNSTFGFESLYNSTGSYNTAFGRGAGYSNMSGNANTLLGYSADVFSTSLSTSTAIGAGALVDCSNCLVLGGTGSNYVKVGIGTTTPSATLTVRGTGSTDPFLVASSTGAALFTISGLGNVGIGTTTPFAKMQIDIISSSTVASNLYGEYKKISDTGNVVSGSDKSYGSYTDINHTGATGGNVETYGQYTNIVGDTGGGSTAYGTYGNVTGADSIYGSYHSLASDNSGSAIGNEVHIYNPSSTAGKYLVGNLSTISNNANFTTTNEIYGTLNLLGKSNNASAGSTMYGIYNDVYNSGGSGYNDSYGSYSKVVGDADGTSLAYGYYADVEGADTNYMYYGLNTAASGKTLYGAYIDVGSGAGTEYSGIFLGGNFGIGTTTPSSKLTVAGNTYIGGDLSVTGTFRDSSNASGTAGMVLQTTGTGTQWVATSSLGISGGASTFLGLTDTISSFNANRVLYTSGSAVVDSADFVFNGTNLGIGSTTPSARLTVQGASGSTDDLFRVASSTGAQTFGISQAGNVGIATTTSLARLGMEKLNFAATNTAAGIEQYFSFNNAVAGATIYGNRSYLYATNTATTTIIGSIVRVADSTTYGNTVRGLEVQADNGNNTQGENTGIAAFGRTFGVRGTTVGDAGGVYEPAGVYGETEGTSQGNAIRGYSSSITSAALLKLFQDTSTFTGTGLLMNFGNAGGSFSSTTASRFIDFQNAGTSMFTVGAYGKTTIGDGTTNHNAGLQIGYGGICVDNDGSCNASTTGRVSAVSYHTGNSDLAENYFSDENLKTGDVVYLKGGLTIGKATIATKDKVLGVVSTKPGLLLGFDDTSLEAGEVAYPVGLAGRVPVKLSTENGAIKAGDELMLSSLPGVAMKATSTGTVIGIALEDFGEARAYSDTFINQFGDDLVEPTFTPINRVADARINDGCYYGAGSASGDAPCVPLVATTTDGQVAEAEALALAEAEQEALEQLALTQSETKTLATGAQVQVGQVVMFIKLEENRLGTEGEAMVAALLAQATGADATDASDTVWARLVNLANNFIDGVLSVFTLKADRVEVKEELCVDGVCLNADDLRQLLDGTAVSKEIPAPTSDPNPTTEPTAISADEPEVTPVSESEGALAESDRGEGAGETEVPPAETEEVNSAPVTEVNTENTDTIQESNEPVSTTEPSVEESTSAPEASTTGSDSTEA